MATLIGRTLISNIEDAKTLPILNLPEGVRRIRLCYRNNRRLVVFFLRFNNGIRRYAGTRRGDAIELIQLAGEAWTRKIPAS